MSQASQVDLTTKWVANFRNRSNRQVNKDM